jgi:hypothetical protein
MDITGKELAGALTLAASSGLIAKLLVDLVKAGGLTLTWLYPVLAVVFGIAASFAVLFANGAAITQASAATALLAGVLAGAAAAGVLALMRVALSSFSDGRDAAPNDAYFRLPKPAGYAVQSRYVGPYLLYGAGSGWSVPMAAGRSLVYAVRYASGDVYQVPLVHAVDRIEALGSHALVVGADGKDLHLTSVRLARLPVTVDHHVRAAAAQGETRSHGFFYKAESEFDGLLGLPIIGGGESAVSQLSAGSAAILYLRNRGLLLSELGTLSARSSASDRDDGCRASCVDWYGNARPLFVRGRVFALMGYEIVEGKVDEKRIVETRRVNYAPLPLQIAR